MPEPQQLPEILPGNEATFSTVWSSPPFADRITTTVTVTGTENSPASVGDTVVWIIPWLLLVAIAIAVGVWLWRRRRDSVDQVGGDDLSESKPGGAHAAAR